MNTVAPPVHVVWFKRDLRIHDHAPLAQAAQRGPVLPLYICEPSVIQADDFSSRHWTFIRDSLQELREALARLGQPLVVRVGEALDVFALLQGTITIAGIWAHEETGNHLTYQRDRAVRRWAKACAIPLTELPQHGVVRRLQSRDTWAGQWEQRMRAAQIPTPLALVSLEGIDLGTIPRHAELGLDADARREKQAGGSSAAHQLLETFLYQRGQNYSREMSSPLTGWEACSRLSPHIAWGTISHKTLVQTARARASAIHGELANADPRMSDNGQRTVENPQLWLRSLKSFDARLHWHCHFMQKLEDEPQIEFHTFVRAYDDMRQHGSDQTRYDAYCAGQTGYPMIDASMRAMIATGWLNFRMRAMLTSFAAYDLWLDWRVVHPYLARIWGDYEAGIHLCQLQMQSGTTGINTVRIYNPVKQSQDQDPDGVFIRRWVPELAQVPSSFVHTPWLMPEEMQRASACLIGRSYPAPIVDHAKAVGFARAHIAAVRRRPETREQAEAVQHKHGSRQQRWSRPARQSAKKRGGPPEGQLELGL